MPGEKAKLIRIIAILIAAGLLVFLLIYLRNTAYLANSFIQKSRTIIYSRLSFVGNFLSEIKKIKNLTLENIKLKEENHNLLSLLSEQSELKEQNIFLREAINLPMLSGRRLIDAGIFNTQFTPNGYHVLINKGADDGIKKGDIIISSGGILIGIVDQTASSYSKASTVSNLDFKATIETLFKGITGIATGSLGDGIYLDFIYQNDEITEGDIVITSGSDNFPPGLILGKVVRIKSENGSLFKIVQVKPIMNELDLSRVLIISQ